MVPRSLMIVEDEPRLLHSLTFTLRRRGYDVLSAPHAEDALRLLAQMKTPELIITDLQLPGMTGIEFIDALQHRQIQCRIVVMTAFPSTGVLSQLHTRGVTVILRKPFDIQELLLHVEAAFTGISHQN